MSAVKYLLLTVGVASATTCPLNFVGNVQQFVVEQENGKNRRTVPAVERTKTSEDFYDYYSYSSHTGLEQEETSVMFLYRNLNLPNELSFFWIHGIDEGIKGSQEPATVNGLITGVPQGTRIVQMDDHAGEWEWTSSTTLGATPTRNGPNLGGKWNFNKNTDGGAVNGLPMDKNWELKIQAQFVQGIDNWYFYFGDGSEPQKMDPREPVYLHPVITNVDLGVAPYPHQAGKETFCTLVQSETEGEELTYTFQWGDATPDTVVRKKAGELACAEHNFCGPISDTCGGVSPRKVRVSVGKAGCDGIERVLAEEAPVLSSPSCSFLDSGASVMVNGVDLFGIQVDDKHTFELGPVKLSKIPENLRSMAVHVPTGDVAADSIITLRCCGLEVCEFVVSHYHCPPCSGSVNGGFPALLPLSGFESSSCAPKWGVTEEKMVSYRLQVEAGEMVELPPTTVPATSFVVFSQTGELSDAWCPNKVNNFGCGGPCPPNICKCLEA